MESPSPIFRPEEKVNHPEKVWMIHVSMETDFLNDQQAYSSRPPELYAPEERPNSRL
jgi:hypothetical protein